MFVNLVSDGFYCVVRRRLLSVVLLNRVRFEMDVRLTGREKEVLNLLMQGYPNKKIAKSLRISDFTVRDHVSSLLLKYGVENRMRLMVVSGYLSARH